MTTCTAGPPHAYRILSAVSGAWANLSAIEAEAGFPPTAHPHRRKLMDWAAEFGYVEMMERGKRVLYRLTPLGEAYLNEAFAVYGPVSRWEGLAL